LRWLVAEQTVSSTKLPSLSLESIKPEGISAGKIKLAKKYN